MLEMMTKFVTVTICSSAYVPAVNFHVVQVQDVHVYFDVHF
jgi:hypothetical protein